MPTPLADPALAVRPLYIVVRRCCDVGVCQRCLPKRREMGLGRAGTGEHIAVPKERRDLVFQEATLDFSRARRAAYCWDKFGGQIVTAAQASVGLPPDQAARMLMATADAAAITGF